MSGQIYDKWYYRTLSEGDCESVWPSALELEKMRELVEEREERFCEEREERFCDSIRELDEEKGSDHIVHASDI